MRGGYHFSPAYCGCTSRLTLDLYVFGGGLFGRVAGRTLAKALQTENEGFKAAAEAATG
jgi:hypothetical protein